MCGIAGYIGSNSIDVNRIKECLLLMHRRGPNAASNYQHQSISNKNVYLLHSRLKIIDLDDRANQPLRIGQHLIAFNGEIYNYVELKKDLESKGHVFKTQSDTEVLLQKFILEDWNALDQCEGMWSFAVYNEKDGTLTLSRDRFGEKPLYIYRDKTGIYFGSEIKFIFSLLGRKLEINFDHLYRYLVNGYKALYKVEQNFFEGVEELRPGTYLKSDGARIIQQDRYWKPTFQINEQLSYKQAVEGVRERLIESVRLCLRADVPLAFCMSGGIDSNALISIAKNVLKYDVHGFTIVNKDKRYEEQEMVEHAVKFQHLRHTAIPVHTENFLPRMKTLVKQHDAPVYTITYYAHWLLMQSVAEQGYRISISGSGSDELFTGYYDHHNAYLYEMHSDKSKYALALSNWKEHIQPIVRNPYLQNHEYFIDGRDQRQHIYLDAGDFSGFLTKKWSEPFKEEQYVSSLLRNRMLNEMFHEAVPPILHEDDLNAMFYSIENRSPFLDRQLFEFCNQIPTEHLVQRGYAKAVLRDAMRGIVPEKILDSHRKVGFNAPIFAFLDVSDQKTRQYLLNDSPVFEHIRRDKIEDLVLRPEVSESQSKFLFYFISSKMFVEEFYS